MCFSSALAIYLPTLLRQYVQSFHLFAYFLISYVFINFGRTFDILVAKENYIHKVYIDYPSFSTQESSTSTNKWPFWWLLLATIWTAINHLGHFSINRLGQQQGHRFQLLKFLNFRLFFVLYDSKSNVFGFWTVRLTWRHHRWFTKKAFFHFIYLSIN